MWGSTRVCVQGGGSRSTHHAASPALCSAQGHDPPGSCQRGPSGVDKKYMCSQQACSEGFQINLVQLTGFEKQENIDVQRRALAATQGCWRGGQPEAEQGHSGILGCVVAVGLWGSPRHGALLTPLGCSPPWGQPCGTQPAPLAQHQDHSFACGQPHKNLPVQLWGRYVGSPDPLQKAGYQLSTAVTMEASPAQDSHLHPQESHPAAEPLKSPPKRYFIGEQVGSGH